MQEFNLGALVARARQGWKTPLVFAFLVALCTMYTLYFAHPVYRVIMTVIPAPSDSPPQTNTGLSALFGLTAPSGGNYARYQKLLGSTVVAQRLQDKYGMLQYVFRANWDAKNKVWVPPPPTMREYLTGWLLRLAHVPVWAPPDATTLAQYLQNSLLILPSTVGNDIVTISMDDKDVAFAKHVMLATDEQANQVLRDQVARRARQQVAYLQNKLTETTVEDYRQTLLALLGNEEKTLMLTQTDASYATDILSPPIASPIPVSPRPVLSMFVAVLSGVLSGLAVVIFFGPNWWKALCARGLKLLALRYNHKTLASRR